MSATPVVRYLKVIPIPYPWLKLYEIHVDGKVVGRVGTQTVRHDRSLSKGSRVVGQRTHSPRWFTEIESGRTSSIWYETRKQAVARLLRDQNDALPQHEQIDRRYIDKAVEESRDFKKSEINS